VESFVLRMLLLVSSSWLVLSMLEMQVHTVVISGTEDGYFSDLEKCVPIELTYVWTFID
jgi:hypothetical protein